MPQKMVSVQSCAALNQLCMFKTVSQVLLFYLGYYFSYDSVVFIHMHNAVLMNVVINKHNQNLF